ncbi:hypothetical protein [Chryseobacterium luquanense]|uniref:Uncharacterized protein n=1 Tax=Chryseobacterium luquanense TaxID=2983766 RepID=A0ABT3Y257_9FLAO|nr:hypothetical protein [Chryseobacterium luquanense]MCX8532161.1 hypothetical protein [Chryseobacterium luquanense]
MEFNYYSQPPKGFEIIKTFVDLFLFGAIPIRLPENIFQVETSLIEYMEKNPKDYTQQDNNQDLLMLHFEKTIELFLEISTVQERQNLWDWYNNNPNKAIVNKLIALQRKNYSFQYRYFPQNLTEDLIEHCLITMKLMPIQIFSLLANQLSQLDMYISLEDKKLSEKGYKQVYNWIMEYNDYTTALSNAIAGFLSYVKGKPRDLVDFENEDELISYLGRFSVIIRRDYFNFKSQQTKVIEFIK